MYVACSLFLLLTLVNIDAAAVIPGGNDNAIENSKEVRQQEIDKTNHEAVPPDLEGAVSVPGDQKLETRGKSLFSGLMKCWSQRSDRSTGSRRSKKSNSTSRTQSTGQNQPRLMPPTGTVQNQPRLQAATKTGNARPSQFPPRVTAPAGNRKTSRMTDDGQSGNPRLTVTLSSGGESDGSNSPRRRRGGSSPRQDKRHGRLGYNVSSGPG